MTLHIVNKSPFETNSLETCLRLARSGHCVLLFEDGVYGASKGTRFEALLTEAMQNCKIHVLLPDFEARGMKADNLIAGIETVDYLGFVDLVTASERVQSWL
ncbi:sulfurtransferase complex subunit TusB [Candidatus Halobeggiatoa sp. HSG11]|nr:sulfurtransferase complex subunit TusB [Candidatus Halobeggiatoa sp. HSG11]